MSENVILTKSFDFAVRTVNLYKYGSMLICVGS